MNTFKSIYWHQGLFLKPHHFQYLYARIEQENLKLKEAISPFFWGVRQLKIDTKELLNKKIVIEELEVVFMDGSRVAVGENAVISSRIFEKKYEEREKDIILYVGVKTFDKRAANVTELDSFDTLKEISTRFVTNSESSNVENLYHEDEPAQIQFMDYYLKLFFDDEIADLHSYQVLPIAKIKKEDERVILGKFVPPLLESKNNALFFETIKMIQADLTSHILQLQEYKLPSHVVLQEPNYLKYVMALQALSPYVPKLEHMIKTSRHPFHFYELFLEVIGTVKQPILTLVQIQQDISSNTDTVTPPSLILKLGTIKK